MRSFCTAALLLALAALTACGAGGGDADDVPTITTRPSASDLPTSPTPTETTTSSAPATTPTASESSVPAVPPTAPVTTESGPSPEPPTDEPGGPTTYRAAETRIAQVGAASSETTAAERFSTKGDVLYCLLDDTVIGPACELRTGFIKDDDVCGADIADGVGRVETYQGEARPVCNSDTIREPGAPVIEAPALVASGMISCGVESIGVTCIDPDSHTGFFLGPHEYHVF
jgi:hypothetical protein